MWNRYHNIDDSMRFQIIQSMEWNPAIIHEVKDRVWNGVPTTFCEMSDCRPSMCISRSEP